MFEFRGDSFLCYALVSNEHRKGNVSLSTAHLRQFWQ